MAGRRTVILSTHILPEAQQVCDRVLIINKGRIVTEDTPEQLQARLTGSQRVSVQIRGDVETLLPQISRLPGIIGITPRTDDRFEFETAPGQEAAHTEAARSRATRSGAGHSVGEGQKGGAPRAGRSRAAPDEG